MTAIAGALASVLVVFGWHSVLGQAPTSPRPDFSRVEIKVSKLADNLYRLAGQGETSGFTGLGGSVGALVGPDGVLLVDSQFAALADKVIAAVGQISDGRIRFLVNTHVHGDHTGGNESLGRMGVTILAREELRRRLADPATGGAPPGPSAMPMVTYRGPTTMHVNGEDVRLIPLPTAHTDGDTLVVFPKADVIMTGDLFRTLGYPIIDRPNGGTLPGLLGALAEIIRLSGPATTIVPGHGEVAHRTAVVDYRDMIVAVRDQVAPMVQRGMTLEQVLAAAPTSSYNSRVRGWDGPVPGGGTTADRFVSQLYAELKTGAVLPAGQEWRPPAGVPRIAYEADAEILKWPDDVHPGEIAGVARNARGDFYIFSRGRETQLFEFDKNGRFVKEIGKNLYGFDFAHSVRVDSAGNIWAVDEGANMVIKFNPQGRVAMTLGRKWERVEGRPRIPEPGEPLPPARPNAFNRPTDIAWDRQGNAYISDGHHNSRVVKIGRHGEWLMSWGQRGKGRGEFNLPHTIAVDSKDRIYVGDYVNTRIQVFDTEGAYLRELTGFGHPGAICITPPPAEFLYSTDGAGHFFKIDLDGRVLGWFGAWGKRAGEFNGVRGMHCQSEHELYIGEMENWRVQKVTLRPDHPGR